MNILSSSSGFSPPIEITLDIDDRQLAVAEVGPDYVVVQAPNMMGPADGILTISVDGRDVRRRVSLPSGINTNLDRQPLLVVETPAPRQPVGAD